MVDVGTGLMALGSAEVSKDAIQRMLGPTADYIGGGVQQWTERRVRNVQRVFKGASDRLGPQLDRPGMVPPRVLKGILEEGQFAEDELMAEYLGGVLASSRSESGRDDSAASVIALIGRLSTYAIRTHFCCYAAARRLLSGGDIGFRMTPTIDLSTYVPLLEYVRVMDFSGDELHTFSDIATHAMHELTAETLMSQWAFGDHVTLRNMTGGDVPGSGLVFTPTQRGVLLFSLAHGIRLDPLGCFTEMAEFPELQGAAVPEAFVVRKLAPFPTPEAAALIGGLRAPPAQPAASPGR